MGTLEKYYYIIRGHFTVVVLYLPHRDLFNLITFEGLLKAVEEHRIGAVNGQPLRHARNLCGVIKVYSYNCRRTISSVETRRLETNNYDPLFAFKRNRNFGFNNKSSEKVE